MGKRGPLLLLVTAALWGLAFVAQASAAQRVPPFSFNASRNLVGTLFLCGVIAWRDRTGEDAPPGAEGSAYSRGTLLVAGAACGLILCLSSYLQQLGIASYPPEAAASSRSGFVTSIYMVMVAVIGSFVGRRPHRLTFVAVGVSLVGMYLLCVPNGLGHVYLGDLLVIACAFGYAVHILVIDRFTRVDGVRLSRVQLLVSGIVSLACALALERPDAATLAAAAIPILYAGICSDGIAYTLQIVAQKTTDPTVASIIMSLEAVFAALGGWLLLSERLSPVELVGCALVLAAALLAQLPDLRGATRRNDAAGS